MTLQHLRRFNQSRKFSLTTFNKQTFVSHKRNLINPIPIEVTEPYPAALKRRHDPGLPCIGHKIPKTVSSTVFVIAVEWILTDANQGVGRAIAVHVDKGHPFGRKLSDKRRVG